MNVLLLGSGGRECALAWKLSQSPLMGKFFIAPGNAGTSAYGTNLDIKPTDFPAVAKAIADNDIDLVIAGNSLIRLSRARSARISRLMPRS